MIKEILKQQTNDKTNNFSSKYKKNIKYNKLKKMK